MSSAPRKVNVLCVAFNNEATIEDLLFSLASQSEHIECVVVVDNDSSDSTRSVIESLIGEVPFSLKLVSNANTGFASGMKLAGEQDILSPELPSLCINPDLRLRDGLLAEMLAVYEHGERIGVLTAPLVGVDGEYDSASVRRLPSLGAASLYGVLGKLTPERFRYNRQDLTSALQRMTFEGHTWHYVEATTGALMMVNPEFRRAREGIFDTDYWMYGEDLQLCHDAREEGWHVAMIESGPSLHVKGVSSGWPRSKVSNRAFHEAMVIYFMKNLARGNLLDSVVRVGIRGRYALSSMTATLGRAVKRSS